jgi:hypothetical protein
MSAVAESSKSPIREMALVFAALVMSLVLTGCGSTEADDARLSATTQRGGASTHLALATAASRRGMKSSASGDSSDVLATGKPVRSWKSIVLHHSATETGSVESIHAQHVLRKDADGNPWLGIGYHFVIGNGRGMPDGDVQATFRWHDQLDGAHAGELNHNKNGIGICLVGDFNREPPTEAQQAALSELLNSLQSRFQIADTGVIRHSAIKPTACPGKFFDRDEASKTSGANVRTDRRNGGR